MSKIRVRNERFMVYLLHLGPGIKRGRIPIRHYLGATRYGVLERLRMHETGKGAALLRECKRRGIAVRVARVWECHSKDLAFGKEITLKMRRNHKEYCLFCSGGKAVI